LLAEGGGSNVKFDTTIVGVVGDIKHEDLKTDIGRLFTGVSAGEASNRCADLRADGGGAGHD